MKNNSILIISNNEEVSDIISGKIKLLRECDKIKKVNYIETISELNNAQPTLIILYKGKTDTIGIVKEIRKIKSLNKVPIIFVMDKLEEESLFYAFDNGIDDFFFMDDTDAIILIRLFLTMQKAVLYKQIETNEEILKWENIIDKQTQIFTKESGARIINKTFAKIKDENNDDCVFIYIKPMPKENKVVNINKIGQKIKNLLRNSDVISYGKGSGYYIVLYNAGKAGAKSITDRIKKAMKNDCIIYANATEIKESFEKTEELLYSKMKKQISSGKEYEYVSLISPIEPVNNKNNEEEKVEKSEQEVNEVQDKKEETEAKELNEENKENEIEIKENKISLYKDIENITAPTFFEIESEYANKLEASKIKYEILETESNFIIQSAELTIELKITYTEYPIIKMEIKQYDETAKTKIKTINCKVEEYTKEKLTLIMQEMINDYTKAISLQKLYKISQ